MSAAGRPWLRRLGLVLGGALVGLCLAEAVGRLDGFARGNDLVFMAPMSYPRDIYVKGGDMTYPNPKFTGTIQSFGYSVTPRFSQWGTRGDAPKPGERTWIAVGDSFTIALQVEERETFSALLATKLGAQVINAGVDGYSTWKEAVRAVQLGRVFPPEGVLALFFTGNDFADNRQHGQVDLMSPPPGPGEPGSEGYAVPMMGVGPHRSPVFQFFRDRSVLVAHYSAWQSTRTTRSGRDPGSRHFKDELGIFTVEGRARGADLESTRRALDYLAGACRRLGARCVVAVVPPSFTMDDDTALRTFRSVGLDGVTPDLDGAQADAVGAAKAAGLTTCDLMPALRAAAVAGERPYLPFDGHLSVRGHQVVADTVATCIGG